MKHFRPINTFATWLLEKVDLHQTKNELRDGKVNGWIHDVLGLWPRNEFNALSPDIYLHTWSWGGDSKPDSFYFPTAHQAKLFADFWHGQHITMPMEQGIRRNEPIMDHFTMEELKLLYGDPLPNVIQYLLIDHANRLGGYLDSFKYMHHEWSRDWLPSAFVHIGSRSEEENHEIHRWFFETLNGNNGGAWQKGWAVSVSDIYEFDDPMLAMTFKLRFGSQPIPVRKTFSRVSVMETLSSHIPGLAWDGVRGNFGSWTKQPNIPDYRKPQIPS